MNLHTGIRGLTAVLASTLMFALTAQAAAPAPKTQAPGYYRVLLGDFEVTAISDGTFPMPVGKLLKNVTPAQLEAGLKQSFLTDPVEASVNAFLINTGSKLVLVDTGAGVFFGPTLGRFLANLKAAGYRPDQIDEIYITHFHGDHVGGLLEDGKPAFPNALVRAAKQESDYWLNEANRDAAPAEGKDGFKTAAAALGPYVSAGKYKPFDGETELVPGVRAIPSFGHTPGHTVYVIESKGQKLLLWGDLMHVAAVQFADPSIGILYDSDSALATAERRKLFADAANKGYWVGGAHLPFPGLGHVRSSANAYAYVPANYSALH